MTVDLDQNADWSRSAVRAEAMPTLISHGELHSLSLARPLLPAEWLAVQGWPTFNMGPEETRDLFASIPERWALSDKAVKDLCGNSIHLTVFHALIAWLLSVVAPE